MPIEDYKDSKAGKVTFILGNGPSLAGYNISRVQDPERCITMNRSWRLFPETEYHVVIDDSYYLDECIDWIPKRVFHCSTSPSIPMDVKSALPRCDFVHIRKRNIRGLHAEDIFDLTQGHKVMNTGALAIILAVYLGYRYIFLLGYDCYGEHFMESKGKPDHKKHIEEFEFVAEELRTSSRKVTIANCSRDTEIPCWPKLSFGDALDWTNLRG